MPVEEVDRGPDEPGVADALEDVVGAGREDVPYAVGGGEEVRRPELPGHRLLLRVRVHGDDRQRARDPRALEDVEADAAGADDDDGLAAADLRAVQYGSDAGEDAAAHEGRGGQRDVPRDLDGLDGLDDGPFRERRVRGELEERLPVARERLPRHPDGLPAHGRPAPVAVGAGAAVGERGQGDVVAGGDVRDPGAHGLDDAGALVAEDDGRGERDGPVDDGQIAVAEPGGGDPDEHLPRTRVPYLQVVDDLDLLPVEDDTPHDAFPPPVLGRSPAAAALAISSSCWSIGIGSVPTVPGRKSAIRSGVHAPPSA